MTAATSASDQAFDDARRGDDVAARESLSTARRRFERGRWWLNRPWMQPLAHLPGTSAQLEALDRSAAVGAELMASGSGLLEVADARRLTEERGRVDLARVRRMERAAATGSMALAEAVADLRGIPRRGLLAPVRSAIDARQEALQRLERQARDARAILDALPALLGGAGERRYLVAFVNNAEQRGAGGLFGNYAELIARDGELAIERSGSTKDLEQIGDPTQRRLLGPPDYLSRYGSYEIERYLRDATASPHFASDASAIVQIVEQSGFGRIDGVIGVDIHALAGILELTGPVQVPGLSEPLASSNARRLLLRDQYLQPGDDAARKELLDEATRRTFDAVLQRPLPSPWQLSQTLGPMVEERHLMTWLRRPEEQALARRLGLDGGLQAPEPGDLLLVSHQNAGNNKIDAYLRRSLRHDIEIDACTGAVRSTAVIELENSAPGTGLPDYVIGNSKGLPPGTNLMRLSVFSTSSIDQATIDGRPLPMALDQEVGLTTATATVEIPPGGSVRIEVDLRGTADLSGGRWGYRYVPQASANPDRVEAGIRIVGGQVRLDTSTVAPAAQLELDPNALRRGRPQRLAITGRCPDS